MITRKEAARLAKRTLSQRRYEHTRNVEKLAVRLAERNGVSEEKAALAALLHDIAKELPKDRMLQLIAENDIIAEGAAKRLPPVWHGAAAAVLAKTEYGVEDEEILSAIRCHTTGKPHMSKLDKVLYLADMASYERTYPEAATLRQHALQNLDKTMVEALGMSISWLKETGKPVDELSLQAYHSFVQSFTEDTPVEQRQTLRQAPRQIDISRARRRPQRPARKAAARPRHPRPGPACPLRRSAANGGAAKAKRPLWRLPACCAPCACARAGFTFTPGQS